MERAIKLAKDKFDNGFFVIVSLISPFKSLRDRAKEIVGPQNLVEVYVNTPLNICEERDTKGLYKKARAGLIKHMTGIDSIYEVPQNPDIVIDTVSHTIDDCVTQIMKFLS
jgi:adenylylsulfate kinase-like enzyme